MKPFDPEAEKRVYRRRLPHWRQDGVTYFVTFRLADSLPRSLVEQWKAERLEWLARHGIAALKDVDQLSHRDRYEFRNHFSARLEEWLDAGHGSRCLADPRASASVQAALFHFDGERYALGEFVIMPTHVHVLVTPAPGEDLSAILQSWKSHSAEAVNAAIGGSESLWMDENFDHIVRNEEQLRYFEGYIRENPVKAGLTEKEFRLGSGQGGQASALADDSGRVELCLTLGKLGVRHFRCFERFETEFAPGMNFIVGPNARGKTSLLEAACILLRLQSPRVTKLGAIIQHGRRGFAVDGYLGSRHLQFYFSDKRKKLALDEVEQKSAAEYLRIGRLVYFSNKDIDIARGSGEVRRRFLDFIAVQQEPGYRRALRDYERALRSRNLLLKAATPRWREIAAFDEPLVAAGERVTGIRRQLVANLQRPVAEAHASISAARETLRLEYVAGAGEDFPALLLQGRKEDARLRQTNVGPHRDDLRVIINEQSSDFASEGQQRTFVLALKLGAARLIEQQIGVPPLLLLDDIFGELDPARRNALFEVLPETAQKLITATHLDWLRSTAAAHVLRLD